MDQARSTISKIFNGEPHSYTRFNLTQNMEGDTSQVEMKLSEVDEETGGNGVGDHLNHNSTRKPYLTQKLGRTPKNLCFMVTATLLIFIIGYLIGYLVHQKKEVSADCSAASSFPFSEPVAHETGAAPLMEWDKVEELLSQKLSPTKFESVFSEFVKNSHRAGSYDDENLGNKVIDRFNQYGLKTWTDEHFVKVHDAPASGFNKVVFKDKSMNPSGFLSYSASGTALGPLLYAHYGRESDFKLLQGKSISLSGKVVLLRAGKISFAEKVANAAKVNASAVLIYADPTEYSIGDDTQLFGHVHLGSGDPYTPGFPSFNHTQFPPVQSSGLPTILAQTITTSMAVDILRALGGPAAPSEWGVFHKLGGDEDVNVTVNNVLVEKKIHNVFGVIKGFVDPDRYVVIGAQRDAWGPGFATSTVGTSVLVELARAISDMVKHNGFKPRRSIVFASWSAGEYGSVGVTEWLEGYLSSLSMKAFAYINLDGVVSGHNGFKVAASPLLLRIIKNALKEVTLSNKVSLYDQFSKSNWESNMMETMKMDNAAYPFLAFSGIPSVSFRFSPNTADYQHSGTLQDTQDKLNLATSNQVPQLTDAAARFAGQLVLRLVHDHLLPMDMTKYTNMIRIKVAQINGKVNKIKRMKPELLPKALTVQWLISAAGSLKRASDGLMTDIQNSDLEDIEMCRIINDRIMSVEKNLLSPYVSPSESPFRHILMGSGPHTLEALSNHLDALSTDAADADADLFHNQFARVTWTIKGSANSLAGDIWAVDNEI